MSDTLDGLSQNYERERNEFLKGCMYSNQLLEEEREARASGDRSEWITSKLIPGLLFKVSNDDLGIAVKPKLVDENFTWNPEGNIVGGLAMGGGAWNFSSEDLTLYMCTFTGPWQMLDFSTLKLVSCNFVNCTVDKFSCNKSKFVMCQFEDMEVSRMYCGGAVFDGCNMDGIRVNEFIGGGIAATEQMTVHIEQSSLVDVQLQSGTLPYARFSRSILSGLNFGTVKLDNVDFPYSDLSNAEFRESEFTRKVSFSDVTSVKGAKFTRENLDALPDQGGLTLNQRRTLYLHDPLAMLRNEFSGILAFAHLASLILFALPYMIFLSREYLKSVPTCSLNCETIIGRFIQFIYTGGRMDGELSWSLVLFIVLLVYNSCRGALLWKTKQLELQLIVSGVPPKFQEDGYWGLLFRVTRAGFWLSVVLVLFHTLNFLTRFVPL